MGTKNLEYFRYHRSRLYLGRRNPNLLRTFLPKKIQRRYWRYLSNIRDLLIDKNGNIAVLSNDSRVLILTKDGEFFSSFFGLNNPSSMAFDFLGNILIVDCSKVIVFSGSESDVDQKGWRGQEKLRSFLLS